MRDPVINSVSQERIKNKWVYVAYIKITLYLIPSIVSILIICSDLKEFRKRVILKIIESYVNTYW